jgi:membrane protease YdiL (CAAX protease family)
MLLADQTTLTLPHVLILVLMSTILVGGLRVWATIAQRLSEGKELVPATTRTPVPWGLLDLFVAVMLWLVLFLILLSIGQKWFGVPHASTETSPEMLMPLMWIDSIAKLMATGGMFLLIRLRTRCSWSELGLSSETIASDLRLGLFAFLALAIPTYLMQVALVQFWPSKHPLVEMLEHDSNHQVLLTAIFMAVGCAPLVEEFFFRVLFQGWLEKLFVAPQESQRPGYGESIVWGERQPVASASFVSEDQGCIVAECIDAPETSTTFVNLWMPIAISSLVFALMHYSHGPDWVALLILATGLGYLYQRTHRLLPCLTVHFLLNGTSMLMLALGLVGGK